ncbi:MAG: PIG-L deacetylase family protein [Nanoarchaeota archaeon]
MKASVMVICAHSDDQIFGCGGTIAKYAREGSAIHTLIFSFGEGSHPWLLPRHTAEMRVKEAHQANALIGGKSLSFLGIKEGDFNEPAEQKRAKRYLAAQIREKKPAMIFTHSPSDPHPNHRSVYQLVLDVVDKARKPVDVYSFDVWNPVKIWERHNPRLVVDISGTFATKIKALRLFKSQSLSFFFLAPSVFIGAIVNGLSNGCTYAEVFLKVR